MEKSKAALFCAAVRRLSQAAGVVAALMIAASVLIVCQMIFVRFVLNESTIWQTELVVYLMIGATLIGLSYVQLLRGHVNVDLLPLALRGRARYALALTVQLAAIAVVAIVLWYGVEFWHFAYARGWKSDTVWGVTLWKPYLALPVGIGLYLLQLVADLVALLCGRAAPFAIDDSAQQRRGTAHGPA